MFYITTATTKIRALKRRIRAVQGGTSASKTIGILQNLIDLAQSDDQATLTSVVSENMPHLRKGSELDFLNILKHQNYFDDNRWHQTNHQYTFETGSVIEFFGADESGKVHGPRRDRLFINEANHIDFDTFEQLELRTKEFVFLDWNPTESFWFYDEVEGKRDDVDLLILNYLDNEAIPPEVRRSLELRKDRVEWWKVYGLGQRGEIEGRIYTDWQIIDKVPHEAKLIRYWVDFGYSNDPASIGALFEYNGGIIAHGLAYALGMSNRMIGDVILNHGGKVPVVADSSEPKSIDDLRSSGLTVIPAIKGPDSVNYGIKKVQGERMSITKESVKEIKEYRKYAWETDRNTGKPTDVPVDEDNHAMDGIRYGVTSLPRNQKRKSILNEQKAYETSMPYAEAVNQTNTQDTKPMRRPEGWGPGKSFTQPDYQSSQAVDGV